MHMDWWDMCLLTCPSFLIMGAFLQTGGSKPFQKPCPLLAKGSCKMEEGGSSKGCKRSPAGRRDGWPDPPSSRRTFNGFAKLRKPGARSKGKGWWLEPSPAGLFALPPPSLVHLPRLPVSFGDGNSWPGISSGRVVGREAEGPQGPRAQAQPSLGLDPWRGRRRGRRRSAPSMLARPGSGVSRGL